MRKITFALLLLAVTAPRASAFSILGHRIIALRTWEDARKNPSRYPKSFVLLVNSKAQEQLKAYFLGGSEAPDLGALPGQLPVIQDNTHYAHPGLWIRAMFET